jgi:hypothetical protein
LGPFPNGICSTSSSRTSASIEGRVRSAMKAHTAGDGPSLVQGDCRIGLQVPSLLCCSRFAQSSARSHTTYRTCPDPAPASHSPRPGKGRRTFPRSVTMDVRTRTLPPWTPAALAAVTSRYTAATSKRSTTRIMCAWADSRRAVRRRNTQASVDPGNDPTFVRRAALHLDRGGDVYGACLCNDRS